METFSIIHRGDAGSEGIYNRAGEMVMSALEVEHLGFQWGAFIGASDESVTRWTAALMERRNKEARRQRA